MIDHVCKNSPARIIQVGEVVVWNIPITPSKFLLSMSIGWAEMRVTEDGNFRRLGQFWWSRGREMFPKDPWILCQNTHLSWISSKLSLKALWKQKLGVYRQVNFPWSLMFYFLMNFAFYPHYIHMQSNMFSPLPSDFLSYGDLMLLWYLILAQFEQQGFKT